MEIFLLIADELDDLASATRMLLPGLLSFLTATVLFLLTVLAFIKWPLLVVFAGVGVLFALVTGSLIRERLLPRLYRTDP